MLNEIQYHQIIIQVQVNMRKIDVILLLLVLCLHLEIVRSGVFCFTNCQSCNAPTYNNCTSSCRSGTPFVLLPGSGSTGGGSPFTCSKKNYTYYSTSAKWEPVGISSDIPAPSPYLIGTSPNITLSPLTLGVTSQASVCTSSGGNFNYQYFGNITGGQNFTVQHPGLTGVLGNVYYWQVRIMYTVVALGTWANGDTFSTIFNTNSNISGINDTLGGGGGAQSNKICSTPANVNARYRQIDHTFTWNWNNDPLSAGNPLDFTIANNGTASNNWGVMNVIVLVRLCHPYCTSCTGDSNVNVCTACDYANQLAKLSDKTCNLVCANGYGDQSADQSVCILCQPLCKYCYDVPQNCLDCYSPYLLLQNTVTNFSCVSSCPEHYYSNRTGNDTCMICNITCQNCTTLPTKCISCYNGTYLYNFTCVNPCPDGYYADTVTLTCYPCNKYCLICSNTSTNCTVCQTTGPWISYLKAPYTCTTNCGDQFYPDTNNSLGPNTCQSCDPYCFTCAVNATYCFSCNPTYYLLGNTCGPTCPFPEYFTDNATWKCLSCAQYCVTMKMNVYFLNSLNEDLVCDLTFSEDLNWGPADIERFLSVSVDDPIVNLANFNFVYEVVSPRIMRLTLTPKGYIFIYNVTFNFHTIPLQNGNYDFAANNYRFNDLNYNVNGSLNWFLIKAPSLSDIEKKIIDGVSGISKNIIQLTTLPYVQEIKKAGIFAFLLAGAQVTSTACLVNTIPSQNFYEGVRFWAAFIFFDVPPWESNSKKTRFVVVPNVHDLIQNARLLGNDSMEINNRTLFKTSKIDWRFQRTGYSSFFIFDTYNNIFMMVLCWILLAIAHYCIKHKIQHKKIMSAFYSFTIKVHEITIFYIGLSTLLEWIYFDAASFERWLSFGFCIFFNIYFLVYELYIYYDMINYPSAAIGNQKYEYYSVRYGSILKNIRFIEYDPREQWSVKHWFRPYNYHILSYYKKFLMMASLPLFYGTQYAQISVLMALQFFEIMRFISVWPFKSKARNWIRFGLECLLMIFFVSIVIQTFEMNVIMINDPATLQKAVEIFYKIGWVGFVACWTFNLGHIIIMIYDTVIGCRKTNKELMDQARKIYYMEKLNSYEEQNQDVPLALVNRWVKLGNLNDRKLDDLPDLNLRVQYFRLKKSHNGFQIEMKKLFQVFMNIEFNYQKENNLSTGKKLNKRLTLTKSLSPTFYGIIENLYNEYMSTYDFEYLVIKTFQKVVQSEHKPGEKIVLDPKIMTQRVELQTYAGQKKVYKLESLLPGFPLSYEDLKQLM